MDFTVYLPKFVFKTTIMKTLAVISTLLLFEALGIFHSNEITPLLNNYIKWTQTGEEGLSSAIFGSEVELSYLDEDGDTISIPFLDYQMKIENAATSVARTMTIIDANLHENLATAYLTDDSNEGDFSLVHQLSLKKENQEWTIYAIRITYRYRPHQ
jgi:hypothetical protein